MTRWKVAMKKSLCPAAMALLLFLGAAGRASSLEAEEPAEAPPAAVSQERSAGSPAAELLRQVDDARKEAENAGASELYPEQFAEADSIAERARDIFNAGGADAAMQEGEQALAWYRFLKNCAGARGLRQKILEYGFDGEDPEAFADAEAKYGEAIRMLDSDPAAAEELSMQALAACQAVCNAGFMRIAEEERSRALEAMATCDSIKAARSMPSEHQAASSAFDSAGKLGEQGLWEECCKGYRDSSLLFGEVYQGALYKRNAAENAISSARARQEASRALALEADEIAPLSDDEETAEAGAKLGDEHSIGD